MDRDVPLQGDAHRHEDGRTHADGLGGVQQVGEEQGVGVSAEVETASGKRRIKRFNRGNI